MAQAHHHLSRLIDRLLQWMFCPSPLLSDAEHAAALETYLADTAEA